MFDRLSSEDSDTMTDEVTTDAEAATAFDLPRAIERLLAMADRTSDFPSGHIMVHPDELIDVVEMLTVERKVIGCGCLLVDDDEGGTHVIANTCSTHGGESADDLYGDGFWAGYMGGDGIDPDELDADGRAEWDRGYGVGLSAANPERDADVRVLRPR